MPLIENFFIENLIIVLILLTFSLISYWKQLLDLEGILLGLIVGVITYVLGGFYSFIAIVVFFIVAESSTKIARKIKVNGKPHERRNIENILGNSGAALLSLALISVSPNIAFFGSIAAALSDTISGEIGMLSKSKPRMITSFKEVEPGTNGAISLLGLIAGLMGAALIALIYFLASNNLLYAFYVFIAGFIGSLTDSFLGATLEKKDLLNNTSVNFLASAFGAILALALFLFFKPF